MYVAPATANSIVLDRVKSDKTVINILVAAIITANLADKLRRALQIMTGLKSKMIMIGVRSIRTARSVKDRGSIWTWESLDILDLDCWQVTVIFR